MLKKTIKIITVIQPSWFLFTCALSRAIYLGPNDYTLKQIMGFRKTLGKRNSHVLYWEEIFDNQH